ncbi:ABC transporter permease [Lachnospiraceae bacterium]|uniref:ABC transporter ATP-binding protein n=1 Tax=Extibacter sp. GGCC_0201 TaxID=2731209 RepID=UPI001AA1ACED|nr:ABC transporter ATP-binding protein [Extibacter sp. GGCC_0201]MBO1722595.1 ABC transporter ATP-binding protein [Extibacter sp. GGCC_0201]BDF35033.1 ABC transporter permease [Lachnospiraceae bacterium]BDF39034.1 ABC transporter permease [Lachnospiraceae bacterium]
MKLYDKRGRLLIVFTLLLGGISAALSAFISIILQKVIDSAARNDMDSFSKLILATLIYLAILGTMGFLEAYCGKLMIKNVTKTLRDKVFLGVMKRSPREFSSQNTADYLSALINDVKLVEENHLIPLLLCAQMGVLFLTTLGILLYLSPLVTAVLFLFLVLMFTVPALLGRKIQKKQDAYSEKLAEFTAKSKDFFNGFEVIRGYSMRPYILKKFTRINRDTAHRKMAADTLLAVNECFSDILSAVSVLVIVFVSSYLMMKGRITAGTLLALIQLSGTFVTPVVMLMQNIPKITGIRPVLKHLEAYSHMQEDAPYEEESSCGPALLKAGITCTDVTFGYAPEQNVLQDISLTIAPGTKCALMGESGGGKTTLIKLLTGYYDDFAGDIRYDGIPIGKLSQDKLNRMAAVIHQNVFLFDTDIYDNICLGETFTKEQLDDAVKASGISRFLPGLEKGLHTAVGENGQNLSGGQRQRIAVARALIRSTPLLIMDEGTSAIDRQAAHEIEEDLLSQENLTVLTITHHMDETLMDCYDRIYYLNDGRISCPQIGV